MLIQKNGGKRLLFIPIAASNNVHLREVLQTASEQYITYLMSMNLTISSLNLLFWIPECFATMNFYNWSTALSRNKKLPFVLTMMSGLSDSMYINLSSNLLPSIILPMFHYVISRYYFLFTLMCI